MKEIKDRLSSLKYNYEAIEESIFLVKDFLTDEEIVGLWKQIEQASQSDWETHYMNGVVGLALRKYGRDDIENLIKEGLVEVTDHWYDKNLSLNYSISKSISQRIEEIFNFDKDLVFEGAGTIQRQYSGAPLREHVDNHADPKIEYAVIAYINDDYVSGELFFSNLDIEIVPPAKSLLIFPSGEKYLHGVNPPGDGPNRYVLPSFVRKVA